MKLKHLTFHTLFLSLLFPPSALLIQWLVALPHWAERSFSAFWDVLLNPIILVAALFCAFLPMERKPLLRYYVRLLSLSAAFAALRLMFDDRKPWNSSLAVMCSLVAGAVILSALCIWRFLRTAREQTRAQLPALAEYPLNRAILTRIALDPARSADERAVALSKLPYPDEQETLLRVVEQCEGRLRSNPQSKGDADLLRQLYRSVGSDKRVRQETRTVHTDDPNSHADYNDTSLHTDEGDHIVGSGNHYDYGGHDDSLSHADFNRDAECYFVK